MGASPNVYTQTEMDAKLEQFSAELINLREVVGLQMESAANEAREARTYIDRILLILLTALGIISYLFVNNFRHQQNSHIQRMRRMIKEGETLLADVDKLLSRPDVEHYRASRRLSEVKSQLKESSGRVLSQNYVRDVYEVAADPHLPALLFVQAKAIKAEQAGRWNEAVEHWKEVLSLDSSDPDNYLHLAHTYKNLSSMTTGDKHDEYLEESVKYYQEYATRTKGLHDAFEKGPPPAMMQETPAIEAHSAVGIPDHSNQAGHSRVVPKGITSVRPAQTFPAAQAQQRPAQKLPPGGNGILARRPTAEILGEVKRTASTISNHAERKIGRSWDRLKGVTGNLLRSRENDTFKVFSAGDDLASQPGPDGAIADQEVAQSEAQVRQAPPPPPARPIRPGMPQRHPALRPVPAAPAKVQSLPAATSPRKAVQSQPAPAASEDARGVSQPEGAAVSAKANGHDRSANGAASPAGGTQAVKGSNGSVRPSLDEAKRLFQESIALSDSDPGASGKLLAQSISLHEQCRKNHADDADFYRSWGLALIATAVGSDSKSRKGIFTEAADKLKEGNLREPNQNDFLLASLYALANDEKNCRKWLDEAELSGSLDADALRSIPEFEKMRKKPWFNRYLSAALSD